MPSFSQTSLSLATPSLSHSQNLSFSKILTSPIPLFLQTKLSNLSLHHHHQKSTTIRMGGGPRTYPGGVSKWQWRRIQAAKAKQLLSARLSRERQFYELRKRAELKAAASELERPWEVVGKATSIFSATSDEQVKVLADRFQAAGGFDLWSEKDGPQLFEAPHGSPSARFFPKGAVHSVKPYGLIASESSQLESKEDDNKFDSEDSESVEESSRNSFGGNGRNFRRKGRRRRFIMAKNSESRRY